MATKTAKTAKTRSTRGKAKDESQTRGPAKETLEFAKKVVRLRDREGLAWKDVASKLGVPYDHNGSSKLRRAYTLGEGKTVGARAAKTSAKPTTKASAKRTKKGSASASNSGATPAARRTARQRRAARSA